MPGDCRHGWLFFGIEKLRRPRVAYCSVVFLLHLASSRHLALNAAAPPEFWPDSHTHALVAVGVQIVVGICTGGDPQPLIRLFHHRCPFSAMALGAW